MGRGALTESQASDVVLFLCRLHIYNIPSLQQKAENHAELQYRKWLDGIKNLKIKKKNQASQIESE